MQDLVQYLVQSALGIKDAEISEDQEDDRTIYSIKVPEESIGLIIGKSGNTIKTFRRLLKIRATLEKRRVDLRVA
jgi:predicted RNA-binding protein YlqC (UPF0109 family)